mmetsp:Transcript_33833/g.49542  ORF Transcript_33833/g.49542 Transcript_33833/m.49542 type:complete len:242 (-) Transcript_33833:911-1636(-)
MCSSCTVFAASSALRAETASSLASCRSASSWDLPNFNVSSSSRSFASAPPASPITDRILSERAASDSRRLCSCVRARSKSCSSDATCARSAPTSASILVPGASLSSARSASFAATKCAVSSRASCSRTSSSPSSCISARISSSSCRSRCRMRSSASAAFCRADWILSSACDKRARACSRSPSAASRRCFSCSSCWLTRSTSSWSDTDSPLRVFSVISNVDTRVASRSISESLIPVTPARCR